MLSTACVLVQVGRLQYDAAVLYQCNRSGSPAPGPLLGLVEVLRPPSGPPPWAGLGPWDPSSHAAGCRSPTFLNMSSVAFRGGSPQPGSRAPNGGLGWGALRGFGGARRAQAAPMRPGGAGRAGTGVARPLGPGEGPAWRKRGEFMQTLGRQAFGRSGLGSAVDITALSGSGDGDPMSPGGSPSGRDVGSLLRRQCSLPLIGAETQDGQALQVQESALVNHAWGAVALAPGSPPPEQRNDADAGRHKEPQAQAPPAPKTIMDGAQAPAQRSDAESWRASAPDAPQPGAGGQPEALPGGAGNQQPAGAGLSRPVGFAERYVSKHQQPPISEPRRGDKSDWRARPSSPLKPCAQPRLTRAPSPLLGRSSGGSQADLSELLGPLTAPGDVPDTASAFDTPPGLAALPFDVCRGLRRSLSLPRLDIAAGQWVAGDQVFLSPAASREPSPAPIPMQSPLPERAAGVRAASDAAARLPEEPAAPECTPDLLAALQKRLAGFKTRKSECDADQGDQGQSQGLRAALPEPVPERSASTGQGAQDSGAAGRLEGPSGGERNAEHIAHEPSWGLAAEEERGSAEAAAAETSGTLHWGVPRPAKEPSVHEDKVQEEAWRTAEAQGFGGRGQGLLESEQEPSDGEDWAWRGAAPARGEKSEVKQSSVQLAVRAEERSVKPGMRAARLSPFERKAKRCRFRRVRQFFCWSDVVAGNFCASDVLLHHLCFG